jgi:hypothetical protein
LCSRVSTHMFRVSLASRIFYSSQRLHMEVNTSCNYHNINKRSKIHTIEHTKNVSCSKEKAKLEINSTPRIGHETIPSILERCSK